MSDEVLPDDQHAPRPGAETLAEPLRSRWSPSVFDPAHELSSEEIDRLLHAGQWAPSMGNTQPWRFIVLRRGTAGHGAFAATLSRGNAGWVPRASVVLVGAAQVAADPADPENTAVKSVDFAHYDTGQAAAHITLQARSMDLHAHQFGGFDHAAAAAALGVPAHFQLMAGIAIGRRGGFDDVDPRDVDRENRARERRPLADTGHDGHWGTPWDPARSSHA